ncbi:hypothetical protein GH714_018460 [Hevea brasiliensis]|uniref:DUF7032 domain-containing protein n=1 Tax=Hevea brasiliensis TaxID=3981 RepID=A0A6A6LPT4_HEVBR|nr:hypothetical protein GH714_018460 [Hevea brasiliensis]
MRQDNPRQDQSSSASSSTSSPRQAIEVVSSLISFSHGIRVFAVKWKMLRNKLEELNTGLIAIENCDSNQNPILSGLVSAILVAANNCYDLARRCVDLSYSGKLLMQSDLDVMAAKFDGLVKNLSGICTAGVLTQGFAIVVSKPGVNACKDDMRFYVRDLLTRMKIGDTEMKRQALVNLHEVVVEDERSSGREVVSLISGFDPCKSVLIGSGVMGPLVRVLESGSELGKEAAARSLQKLTENSDNACCGVLRNLVGVEEIKRFMIEEGAVSRFIKLARSRDEAVQISSIEFLQNIASGDESVRQWCYGFMDRLLFFLRNGDVSVQELALKVAYRLSGTSEDAKKAMGDAGFMSEFVRFLDAKSFEVREMASEALTNVISVPKNRKRFVQDDRNISFLLQLLDQEEANSGNNKKFLISILISLTSSNTGRRKIVNSGYLKNIEKLAEAEVSDAKRLVRKLSKNRFRSMLSGLWHS